MASTPAQTKDRITCHVLDTRLGKPAKGMRVKLELSPPANTTPHHGAVPAARVFESHTDDDGRINVWLPYSSSTSSGEVPVYTFDDVLGAVDSDESNDSSRWTLRF